MLTYSLTQIKSGYLYTHESKKLKKKYLNDMTKFFLIYFAPFIWMYPNIFHLYLCSSKTSFHV